jgi:hypothetical protein
MVTGRTPAAIFLKSNATPAFDELFALEGAYTLSDNSYSPAVTASILTKSSGVIVAGTEHEAAA